MWCVIDFNNGTERDNEINLKRCFLYLFFRLYIKVNLRFTSLRGCILHSRRCNTRRRDGGGRVKQVEVGSLPVYGHEALVTGRCHYDVVFVVVVYVYVLYMH